jgi:hypothetical protein
MFNGNRRFSMGVKRPALEADHALSSVANIKNELNFVPTCKNYFPFSFPLLPETNPMKMYSS